MKSMLVLAMVLLVAGSAIAAPNTPKPNGPLNIYIDEMGVATLMNDGPGAFSFDGYTIASAAGVLPAAVTGIFDNTLADIVGFPPVIGGTSATALAWSELSTTAFNYTEATLDVAAVLQEGIGFSLGAGFDLLDNVDGTFTYVDSASGGSFEGLIIPEPATMSLLALGGLALIRRKS